MRPNANARCSAACCYLTRPLRHSGCRAAGPLCPHCPALARWPPRRRRRGPAPRRYKGGEAEEEGGEEEMQPLAAAPVLPAEGAEGEGEGGKEVPDQGASLDEQLEASRLSVSDEPTLIQTPAAVWLPYGESPAAEEVCGQLGRTCGCKCSASFWGGVQAGRALYTASGL